MLILGATTPIREFAVPLFGFVIVWSLEWGFVDWYLYIYICIEKKTTSSCKNLLFYIFEWKRPRHEIIPFYSFLKFPFRSDTTSSCNPFIV